MSRWETRPYYDGHVGTVFSVPGLVYGWRQEADGRWIRVYTVIEEAKVTEIHESGTQWQHYFHPDPDDPSQCAKCNGYKPGSLVGVPELLTAVDSCDAPPLRGEAQIRDTGWPDTPYPNRPFVGPLPVGSAERKATPICTGVLDYFPDALAEVARVSYAGNVQHGLGHPLRWEKGLSTDEADALVRHLMERGKYDTDGMRHSAKAAWRALALLQRELEAERG